MTLGEGGKAASGQQDRSHHCHIGLSQILTPTAQWMGKASALFTRRACGEIFKVRTGSTGEGKIAIITGRSEEERQIDSDGGTQKQ